MLNEKEIISLIHQDTWMMDILKAAKTLNLPDWWICAGFVRSKIWDTAHHFKKRTPLPDIDVIYFDPIKIDEDKEKHYEEKLSFIIPSIPWSVKNEARMHTKSNMNPYLSATDAMSKFPETATALGVKLDEINNVLLSAPHGLNDVVNLVIKPTPYFTETKERMEIYEERIRKKNWHKTWPKLKIYGVENHYHFHNR